MKRISTFIPLLLLCFSVTAQQGTTYRWKAGNAAVSSTTGFLAAANWWVVNGATLTDATTAPGAGATLELSGVSISITANITFNNPYNIHVYSNANASSSLTINQGVQLNLPQGSVIRVRSASSNAACNNAVITMQRTGGTSIRINETTVAQGTGSSARTLSVACTGNSQFVANGLSTSGPEGFTGFVPQQGGAEGPLPVKLAGFTASKGNGKVMLNWSTAQELNSHFFEVQRSADGSNWTVLSRVNAAGNSDLVRHYSYEDAGAFTGNRFYRLRMVDQDETFALSNIARISFAEGKGKIFAYPNPAGSFTTISCDKALTGDITVGIFHFASGQMIKQQVLRDPGNAFRVGLDGITPGNYIIKVFSGQELLETMKLIKN